MKIKLSTIILSAGKGTRMKSNLSKPLHKIGNLEIINHILKTISNLDCEETVLVVSEENREDIEKKQNLLKLKLLYNMIEMELVVQQKLGWKH